MIKLTGTLVVVVAVIIGAYFYAESMELHEPTEDSLAYFIKEVTETSRSLEGYENLGLAGGTDGFTLRKAYPGLVPSDFKNVQAYQGHYFEQDGELFYEGNAASNSAVILEEGMKTLLQNLSGRLQVSPHTIQGTASILKAIEAGQV